MPCSCGNRHLRRSTTARLTDRPVPPSVWAIAMRRLSSCLVVPFLLLTVRAQTIGIDDLNPASGATNSFPWSVSAGQTSLHVYSAHTLRLLGVCAGATLLDLAIAPSSGSGGVYSAPQVQLAIGHLAVSPPVPGNWNAHLQNQIVVHDLTAGPYTFAWTLNTHVSLPGFASSGFVWDGASDIGILYSSSPGTTGGFQSRRSATQLRHYVPTFGATNQPPTSNGLLAMEVKMTWAPGGPCAVMNPYGLGCDTPALQLDSGFPVLGSTVTLTTTNAPTVAPIAALFFGDQQLSGLDLGFLGAPGCNAWTNGNLTTATFAVSAGSGSVAFTIQNQPSLVGLSVTMQAAAFTLANPLGLATSNGLAWTLGH